MRWPKKMDCRDEPGNDVVEINSQTLDHFTVSLNQ